MIRLSQDAKELRITGEDKVMLCPFCRQSDLPDITGPTICPVCKTEMDIDDRDECVFVNPEMPKMALNGQVCVVCGLVQQDTRDSCTWCGSIFARCCTEFSLKWWLDHPEVEV
jgi:hypothetical protein